MVPSVRFPVQNVLVSKYLRSNKTDVYIYMTVNLYSTKAEFPIPNNTLYSLALLYNKWQNCAKKKKGKEKLMLKTIHYAKYIITCFFFPVQLPDVLHYIIKLIDLVLFLHLPFYNNK